VALLVTGCPRAAGSAAVYPPAVPHDVDEEFPGTWKGTVENLSGVLEIGELGEGEYSAHFEDEFETIEFTLLLERTVVENGTALAPSNLSKFRWQDGEGGRGLGWLLVDADGRHLTGSSGYLDATDGHAAWTFTRTP
jgi:hypothetical protein